MYDETVRMCSLPAWIRVGTETGMYHCNGRLVILALKIAKEGTELSYQEHTFVYDGTAVHGNYVSIIITLFKFTTCDVKHTVKGKTFFHILRFFNKCLHNARHAFECFLSKDLFTDRHFPPSKEFQSFFFDNNFENIFCLIPFQFVLWEEKHSHTVISLRT